MSDETSQETVQSTESAQSANSTTFVYCGPSLPAGHSLKQYQVFAGGLPESVKKLTDECKPLGTLFVTPEKVASTRIALTQKGSVESNMYQAVQAYFKSRKE